MKAEIMPLEGKYYGTIIRVTDVDEWREINVWMSYGPPSRRELNDDCTPEQWKANVKIKAPDGKEYPAQEMFEVCDSHYESARCLQVCEAIVEALNRMT